MITTLLDGKSLRDKKFAELKPIIQTLINAGKTPHLAVVLVGEDPASQVYVKNKEAACIKLGIKSTKVALPSNTSWETLKQEIHKLNVDPNVDGILVQLPLPKHLANESVSLLIDPSKDADGITPFNQGVNLMTLPATAPLSCTPNGIMEFFKAYNLPLEGKNALIIGRSNIVGRPLAYLMEHAHATVTVAHSRTNKESLHQFAKAADIIVLATGALDLITPSMVKPGVVIIDVGIIRNADGTIRGEVMHQDFEGIASYITPVPGGVGPMTITMLMQNVVMLVEQALKGKCER